MAYKVKIGEHGDGSFYGLNKEEYEPGERVDFFLPRVSDADCRVFSDQVVVKSDSEKSRTAGSCCYYFIMPEADVFIDYAIEFSMAYNPNSAPPAMGMMGMMAGADMATMQKMMMQQAGCVPENTQPADNGTPKYCPECGCKNTSAAKFCGACGNKL